MSFLNLSLSPGGRLNRSRAGEIGRKVSEYGILRSEEKKMSQGKRDQL